ncbi:hypothetical protein ACL2XP_17400 [Sodalis sp. RH21]
MEILLLTALPIAALKVARSLGAAVITGVVVLIVMLSVQGSENLLS